MKNMTWQTSRNVFLIWQYLSGNAPWVHCLEVFTLTWPLTAKSQYFYINSSRVGLLRAKTKGHLRTQVWLLGSFPESKQVDGQVSEWYWPCPWWFSLSAFFPYTGLLPRGGGEERLRLRKEDAWHCFGRNTTDFGRHRNTLPWDSVPLVEERFSKRSTDFWKPQMVLWNGKSNPGMSHFHIHNICTFPHQKIVLVHNW